MWWGGRWVVSPPQCRMAGDVMAGLRMQSAVLATPSAHLLLLDCARLPVSISAIRNVCVFART